MDWRLVYRTLDEIDAMVSDVSATECTSTVFDDPDHAVGFIELRWQP